MIAGELDDKQAILMLFENKTWSDPANDYIDETPYLQEVGFQNITNLQHVDAFGWNRQSGKPTGPNLYISLTLFILVQYLSAAVAQTINFPCGVFMPIFMVGAAFGRLVGESMYAWFPAGFKGQSVIPGGYAVVGAAAFAGGVTHTSKSYSHSYSISHNYVSFYFCCCIRTYWPDQSLPSCTIGCFGVECNCPVFFSLHL